MPIQKILLVDDSKTELHHLSELLTKRGYAVRTAMSARADGMLAGREASETLQAALQRLSPELRETVILRDLEEMEYREIAKVLNVPEGTVKSRLNRGRAELARVLRRQNVMV